VKHNSKKNFGNYQVNSIKFSSKSFSMLNFFSQVVDDTI
jgi:hypothetical protein